MPTYTILKETAPDQFTPTGDTFTGTPEEAEAQVQALQAADPDGKCYAMEQSAP